MDREEQIKICQQCKNRKMDFSKGLLCGLTDEFGDFETQCPQFNEDETSGLKHTTNQAYVNDLTIEINPSISKNLLILILIASGIEILPILLLNFNTQINFGTIYFDIFFLIPKFLIWIFIGYTLNKVREASISGLIFVSLLFATKYFPSLHSNTFEVFPYIIPLAIFAIQTLEKRSQQIKFLVIGLIIQKGILLLNYPPYQILDNLFRFSNRFVQEFDQNVHLITGVLITISSVGLAGILLVFAHKWISNPYKIKINQLSLHNVLSYKKLSLFVIIYYSAILLLSLSFIAIIADLSTQIINQNFQIIEFISKIFELLFSLIVFSFICWQYRKVTIEYYLASEKKLSWNYFLAQIPIINLFIWEYNLLFFNPKTQHDRNAIARILNKDNFSLILILLFLICAKLIFVIKTPSVQAEDVILASIEIFVFLFYIYTKYGMYIIIAIEFMMLIGIFIATTIQYEISENLLSFYAFYSIARLFIIYPIFHGNQFKVEIPGKLVKLNN